VWVGVWVWVGGWVGGWGGGARKEEKLLRRFRSRSMITVVAAMITRAGALLAEHVQDR
jgi:hypothetical protein